MHLRVSPAETQAGNTTSDFIEITRKEIKDTMLFEVKAAIRKYITENMKILNDVPKVPEIKQLHALRRKKEKLKLLQILYI